MKNLLRSGLAWACVGVLGLGSLSLKAAEGIKIMTYNVRYASDRGANSWPDRRPVMKECVAAADADIIGTQEGLWEQLKDFAEDQPQYEWLGLGREGGSRGEFMAVFYKPDLFEVMAFDHFWLSDTPEVIGSSTWGNTVKRMVTWVRFKEKDGGQEFYFVNTHFDHQVQESREKSAELVRERITEFGTDLPIILVGDFNAKAGDNRAYSILTEDGFLKDTWLTAKERRGEVVATFNSFREKRPGDHRIDWILGRGIETLWTEIITCQAEGQFPSDHFPVIAEIVWEKAQD